MTNAALEDDDAESLAQERPIRARLIGSQFCEVDGPEVKLSTSGPACVRLAATLLLRHGASPETPMVIHTTAGAASSLRGKLDE